MSAPSSFPAGLDQTLASNLSMVSSKKDHTHQQQQPQQQHMMIPSSLAQTSNLSTSNAGMNLLSADMKNFISGINLGNFNMSNLNMNLSQAMACHNQLESMINVSSPLGSGLLQNNHMTTTMAAAAMAHQQQQQHSNGFSNVKRTETSPSNMLNNNGLTGLGMNLNMNMNMNIGSIFDPSTPRVMPMQISQLQMKKDDKITAMNMAQQQVPPNGRWLRGIFKILLSLFFLP